VQSIVMVSFPSRCGSSRVCSTAALTISLHQGAGGLSVLTLKAAGLLDVDAGEIVRPGIVRIDGDRIVGLGGAPKARLIDLGDAILLPG
jgi:hypothetical protein